MRLIDADKFIEYLGLDGDDAREENLGEIVTFEDFDRQETVDAEPVRHGRWGDVSDYYDTIYRCSACSEEFTLIEGTPQDNLYNYCPHCGAKMDLE